MSFSWGVSVGGRVGNHGWLGLSISNRGNDHHGHRRSHDYGRHYDHYGSYGGYDAIDFLLGWQPYSTYWYRPPSRYGVRYFVDRFIEVFQLLINGLSLQ